MTAILPNALDAERELIALLARVPGLVAGIVELVWAEDFFVLANVEAFARLAKNHGNFDVEGTPYDSDRAKAERLALEIRSKAIERAAVLKEKTRDWQMEVAGL